MVISSNEHVPAPEQAPTPLIERISLDVLRHQLRDFSTMDRRALMETLVPYRELPLHDPAGFTIAAHRRGLSDSMARLSEMTDIDLNSSYDMGVVFASGLVRQSLQGHDDLPVISDFANDKKDQVEAYLRRAAYHSPRDTISRHRELNDQLAAAVELFADHCKVFVPDLIIGDGAAELRRGYYDYLQVVNLLDERQAPRGGRLERWLARFALHR